MMSELKIVHVCLRLSGIIKSLNWWLYMQSKLHKITTTAPVNKQMNAIFSAAVVDRDYPHLINETLWHNPWRQQRICSVSGSLIRNRSELPLDSRRIHTEQHRKRDKQQPSFSAFIDQRHFTAFELQIEPPFWFNHLRERAHFQK